jgi:hypothetical protein
MLHGTALVCTVCTAFLLLVAHMHVSALGSSCPGIKQTRVSPSLLWGK